MREGQAIPGFPATSNYLLPERPMDALTFILEGLSRTAGARALDLGCGSGGLASPLRQAGIDWLGLEPDRAAAEACAAAGHPVIRGDARELPFSDTSFGSAIFLNSLHHVPMGAMTSALAEALRVAPRIIIVEPRPYGDLFDALKPIDDETEVRRAAQEAILRFCQTTARLEREEEWVRVERFDHFEDFAKRMIAADPARAQAARSKRDAMEQSFNKAAMRHDLGGFRLAQPMVGQVLSRA
jgi:SAM-dependent methyltransferase